MSEIKVYLHHGLDQQGYKCIKFVAIIQFVIFSDLIVRFFKVENIITFKQLFLEKKTLSKVVDLKDEDPLYYLETN